MLRITVLGPEHFDNEKQEFVFPEAYILELEHSLVSLSKWEEKWEVPFLGADEKTQEMIFDYVECMLLTPNPPPDWVKELSSDNIKEIEGYFDRKMTATWFNEYKPEAQSGEVITSELVYYWMSAAQIDWQAQYWHINKLLTLIKVHTVKNSKPKPMGRREAAARRKALNEKRLQEGGSE